VPVPSLPVSGFDDVAVPGAEAFGQEAVRYLCRAFVQLHVGRHLGEREQVQRAGLRRHGADGVAIEVSECRIQTRLRRVLEALELGRRRAPASLRALVLGRQRPGIHERFQIDEFRRQSVHVLDPWLVRMVIMHTPVHQVQAVRIRLRP
jgi:hypothetical protein